MLMCVLGVSMKPWISKMLGHEGQVAVALTAGFEYCCSGTIILREFSWACSLQLGCGKVGHKCMQGAAMRADLCNHSAGSGHACKLSKWCYDTQQLQQRVWIAVPPDSPVGSALNSNSSSLPSH